MGIIIENPRTEPINGKNSSNFNYDIADSLNRMQMRFDKGEVSFDDFKIFKQKLKEIEKKYNEEKNKTNLKYELEELKKEILLGASKKILSGESAPSTIIAKTPLYFIFQIEENTSLNNETQNFLKGFIDELLSLPELVELLIREDQYRKILYESLKELKLEDIKNSFTFNTENAYEVGRTSVNVIFTILGLAGLLKSIGKDIFKKSDRNSDNDGTKDRAIIATKRAVDVVKGKIKEKPKSILTDLAKDAVLPGTVVASGNIDRTSEYNARKNIELNQPKENTYSNENTEDSEEKRKSIDPQIFKGDLEMYLQQLKNLKNQSKNKKTLITLLEEYLKILPNLKPGKSNREAALLQNHIIDNYKYTYLSQNKPKIKGRVLYKTAHSIKEIITKLKSK